MITGSPMEINHLTGSDAPTPPNKKGAKKLLKSRNTRKVWPISNKQTNGRGYKNNETKSI